MRMFDADRSGVLNYQEFEQLMEQVWAGIPPCACYPLSALTPVRSPSAPPSPQIKRWRAHFDSADRDRSGTLAHHEVLGALRTFGFALPDAVGTSLMAAFDE